MQKLQEINGKWFLIQINEIEKKDKEIGQENNRKNKIKQTSDEFTEETRYYTPEGEIYETIIETYKCPKNYISKDKIKEKIEKYKCFKWKCKDDEYWANRIIKGFEELLEERN